MALSFVELSNSPRTLPADELHVWFGPLEFSGEHREQIENLLSAEERERAKKFIAPQARDSFVATRAILRSLLSSYLAISPHQISLDVGPHGKPELSSAHANKVCFNVSHSHGMGLCAFTASQPVGADVEKIRASFEGMEIAERFFSKAEIAVLNQVPQPRRAEAFFRCWTRKEAYIKARGLGMSIPLDSFSVEFADTREQTLRDENNEEWSCYDLDVGADYAAAVVARGKGWKLRRFSWNMSEAALHGEIRD